jgi:hypothetical protein
LEVRNFMELWGHQETGWEDFFGGIRNLTFSSHSLAILSSAASEVLLLIWEGQPRHACQAHWGMDSNRATLAHSPHGGEMGRGKGLCQGRVLCAAKRSGALTRAAPLSDRIDVRSKLVQRIAVVLISEGHAAPMWECTRQVGAAFGPGSKYFRHISPAA